MRREIFLLAGEASGDARGAELIRALKSQDSSLSFVGMGGPRMHEAGMEILADVSDLAVVGIVEVLKHYPLFKRTMTLLLKEVQRRRPSIVVGVDYPGFNLRFLRKAKSLFGEAAPRLAQYVSPQLWAWNEKRKWKMAEYLDLVLCIFPFEPKIYEGTGLRAVFVGHPLVGRSFRSEELRDPNLLGLFPGSRDKEIRAHMTVFMELEARLRSVRPDLSIAYAAGTPRAIRTIREFAPKTRIESAVFLQDFAAAGVVCSGTATLEAALAGLPMCVIYRVAWPTYWMGRMLIQVPCLAMPNVLAGRPLVKEWIQSDFTAAKVGGEVERLLSQPPAREALRAGYREIRTQLGDGNAAEKAAQEIIQMRSRR